MSIINHKKYVGNLQQSSNATDCDASLQLFSCQNMCKYGKTRWRETNRSSPNVTEMPRNTMFNSHVLSVF